jgi:hypothetical protein
MANDILTELHGEEIGLDDDRALVHQVGHHQEPRTAAPVSFPDGILGGGGGGTPGGSSRGTVQYNNGGAFGGMAGTAWNNTSRSPAHYGRDGSDDRHSIAVVDADVELPVPSRSTVLSKFNITDTSSAGGLVADPRTGRWI